MQTALDVLGDAELRLEWSERHIQAYEREIQSFHARESYSIVRGVDPVNPNIVRVTDPPAIPAQLNLIASDAVHSMRVSLDYIACCLALLNNRSMSSVSFPIASSLDDFNDSAPSKIKKLSAAGKQFIADNKPYKGGNDNLWAINEINKTDKHRNLVLLDEAPPMWYFTQRVDDAKRDPVTEAPRYDYRLTLVPGFADLVGFEAQSALTLLKEFLRSASDVVTKARRIFFPKTERVQVLKL